MFFSLKITRSIRTPVKTDNGYFFVFRDKFSYFVNLAFLTPFYLRAVSMTEYLTTDENPTETAKNLLNFLSTE